jgi:hypothetical protein
MYAATLDEISTPQMQGGSDPPPTTYFTSNILCNASNA